MPLLIGMFWVLSGLFVAFLMRMCDEYKTNNNPKWIKNRGRYGPFLVVLGGPISLLIGIIVMTDWCNDD